MAMKYLDKYPRSTAKRLWVLKPLWSTIKLFSKTAVRRPVTIQYPYEKEWLPDNYRGRPGLRFDMCVGCGVCERACPTQCIKMIEVPDDNGNMVMRPQVFLGRCAFCGYCAEFCPTNAMTVTPEYELAELYKKNLFWGPRRLHFEDTTPEMEVHYEVTLQSDIDAGNPEKRVRPFEVDNPVVDEGKCIGCKKCERVCPTGAVTMIEKGVNEKGKPKLVPVFSHDKCICCEQCVIDCPKDCIHIEEVL